METQRRAGANLRGKWAASRGLAALKCPGRDGAGVGACARQSKGDEAECDGLLEMIHAQPRFGCWVVDGALRPALQRRRESILEAGFENSIGDRVKGTLQAGYGIGVYEC